MELLGALAVFMLGAVVASFVGVVTARYGSAQSFLSGRSRCDACGEVLSPFALIPVCSFAFSGGRARCCGGRLSLIAPMSEALLGGLFVLTYLDVGLTLALPLTFLSLALLLFLVLFDAAHQLLPPVPLAAFVLMSALSRWLLSPEAFLDSFLLAFGVSAFLLFISVASRGRMMGYADAPFALGLAFLAGPAAFVGLVFSFWVGAAIGIIVLLKRPRGSRMGVEVPFAPFLAAGFLLAHFTQWNPFPFIEVLRLLS